MNVTCNNCGWVAFEVTREFADNAVKEFNIYFETLTKKQQDLYYSGTNADISHYEYCHRCGESYKKFRDFEQGDCPDGCTLNPIIKRTD